MQGHDITTTDEMITTAVEKAQEAGFVRKGDTVVITAVPVGMSGTTNLIKVHEWPNDKEGPDESVWQRAGPISGAQHRCPSSQRLLSGALS